MTSRAKILDQYFTPPELAAKLISYITILAPNQIGDFAAGDGQLLRAAENKWPNVKCTALDIDEVVLAKLKSIHPQWHIACGDFTDSEVRKQILIRGSRPLRFPAIALNPPFSIDKGRIRIRTVYIEGVIVKCSPALAFVIDAIQYVKPLGQLVAIIPHSVIQSEKDAVALKLLRKYHAFEIVEHISRARFSKCAPRTSIIRLTAKAGAVQPVSNENTIDSYFTCGTKTKIQVTRGTISNSKIISTSHQNSLPFIHTTDLSKGILCNPNKNIENKNVIFVTGPAVLLPRVGKPDINKIAILPKDARVVLSDCMIALLCNEENDAEMLQIILNKQWDYLERAYAGTCARYISINAIRAFLEKVGYCTRDVKDSSDEAIPKSIATTDYNC